MRLVIISDTHGLHAKIKLPKGDILLHAGDVTSQGHEREALDFLDWFKKQDYKYKVFIAGNHDFFFERAMKEKVSGTIPGNVIYLNDSGISIEGYKFWGSPITPWFFNWAFNKHRGNDIRRHWQLIPDDTDVLITHGPVFGILDENNKGEHVGCKDLLNQVLQIKPTIHICGHIHEAYGYVEKHDIKFINASLLNEEYIKVNAPKIVDLANL